MAPRAVLAAVMAAVQVVGSCVRVIGVRVRALAGERKEDVIQVGTPDLHRCHPDASAVEMTKDLGQQSRPVRATRQNPLLAGVSGTHRH